MYYTVLCSYYGGKMKKQIKKLNKKYLFGVVVFIISLFIMVFTIPASTICYSDVANHNSLNNEQKKDLLFKTSVLSKFSINYDKFLEMQQQTETEKYQNSTIETTTIDIVGENLADEDEDIVEVEAEEKGIIRNEGSTIFGCGIELTDEEFELLCRTVQTEVTIDEVGQKNVVYVILNRLYSDRFDNTIKDVLFAPNQFAMVGTEKFWTLSIYPETEQHVIAGLNDYVPGENDAQGALFFRSKGYFSWAEYIFTDRVGHNFFK